MRSTLIVAFAGLGAFGFPHMTWADSYSYQTVDVPGSYDTALTGINDSGQIIGVFNFTTGFSETNASFTTLPSVLRSPSAINDSGQILSLYGSILNPSGIFMPVDVPPGTFPNPPGYTLSVYFNDMNNAGQIVGSFTSLHLEGEGTRGNFLYSNGVFKILQPPEGFTLLSIGGIDNSGQIFGTLSDRAGNVSGFINAMGVFSTFQLPPGISGFNAINDSGEMVGIAFPGGFVIARGVVSPIQFPGASYTIVSGINNEGQIVGSYADYSQSVFQHGFIATPLATPEPASLILVGFGLVAGWHRKRRRRT